jgi:hypothetical protein
VKMDIGRSSPDVKFDFESSFRSRSLTIMGS